MTDKNMTESLVKYSGPQLVSSGAALSKSKAKKTGKMTLPELKASTSKAEDYLNAILPPREYTKDGALWVRYVSPDPSSRVDVIQLQDALDDNLQRRQARETGICAIREELYAQCFDELIR